MKEFDLESLEKEELEILKEQPWWRRWYDNRLKSKEELDAEELEKRRKEPWYRPGKPIDSYLFHQRDFDWEFEQLWGRWGAEGIGRLRKVILSRPTENDARDVYEREPAFYRLYRNRTPKFDKWLEEFDDYENLVKGEGIKVYHIDFPIPALGPYGYIRWLCAPGGVLVTKWGAINATPGTGPWMVGRQVYTVRKLNDLGCPILYTMFGKGCVDLGGGSFLDNNHFVISLGIHSDPEGINQIVPIMNRIGIEVHVGHTPGYVDLWGFPAGGCSHPDMILQMVDVGKALIYPSMWGHETICYLKSKRIKLLELPPKDYVEYGGNVVTIEPGKVLIPAAAKETIKNLTKEGVECIEANFSEYADAGLGGPNCITCELLRDPGPGLDEIP